MKKQTSLNATSVKHSPLFSSWAENNSEEQKISVGLTGCGHSTEEQVDTDGYVQDLSEKK